MLCTPPVAYKGIGTSCKRNSCTHFFSNNRCSSIFEKSTTSVTLSILSKTKRVKTMHSIVIGFPILDVDEFVGWVELQNWPLDHLFVVGHGSF